MIPLAGDEITELIVQSYLVDFNTAEQIKLSSGMEDQVTYKDIMMIEHTIPSKDVWKLTESVVDKMTTEASGEDQGAERRQERQCGVYRRRWR